MINQTEAKIDLRKINPVDLSVPTDRSRQHLVFDLGRMIACCRWWGECFNHRRLLGKKNSRLRSTLGQKFRQEISVLAGRALKNSFGEITGIINFAFDLWQEPASSDPDYHPDLAFAEDYRSLEEAPEYASPWHPDIPVWPWVKYLQDVDLEDKLKAISVLGFRFDGAIRNFAPAAPPSSPYEYTFGRYKKSLILESELNTDFDNWLGPCRDELDSCGFPQKVIDQFTFKTTGIKLIQEVYERITNFLNEGYEPPPPEPDKFGLIVDPNNRNIYNTSTEESVSLQSKPGLWQLFKALYDAEEKFHSEDDAESKQVTKKKGLSSKDLAQKYDGDGVSIPEQIGILRKDLAPVGLTVQQQKYRLIPLTD